MLIKPNRFLSNEVDASPGGGATPQQTPSAPPAQTAPPESAAPVIPVDAIKVAIADALKTALPAAINGHFATARRNGDLKKEKEPGEPPASAAAAAPPAGLSMADVQALIKRERVIATYSTKYELDAPKVRWLEKALDGVDPENLDPTASSFISELGLAKATTTAPAPPVPGATAQPLSDKGSPAPGGVLDWEREFAENPIGMSSAARQRMDAKYGVEKARRMRLEAGQRQAEAIKVLKPQG
jgi:hypothetical protein